MRVVVFSSYRIEGVDHLGLHRLQQFLKLSLIRDLSILLVLLQISLKLCQFRFLCRAGLPLLGGEEICLGLGVDYLPCKPAFR